MRSIYAPTRAVIAALTVLTQILAIPGLTRAQSSEELAPRWEFLAEGGPVQQLIIDPTRAIVIGMGPYLIHIWSIRGDGALVARRSVEYPENTIRHFALDTTGGVLAYLVSGLRNEVIFVDTVTGSRLDVVNGSRAGSSMRRGDGTWQLELGEGVLPRRVAIGDSTDRRLQAVAVALTAGQVLYWPVGNEPILIDTRVPRLDAVAVAPDGIVRWAGPAGWGERRSNGRIAEYDITVPEDLEPASVVAPTFWGDDIVYTAQAESAVEFLSVGRNLPGMGSADSVDSIVRLLPNDESRVWSDDERTVTAAIPYSSPPTFVGLDRESRTYLEMYEEGLAIVRSDEAAETRTLQLIGGGDISRRIGSVGVEVQAPGAGPVSGVFATARGSVVSVYELP